MPNNIARVRRLAVGFALSSLALLISTGPAGAPLTPTAAEAAGFVVTSLADSGPGSLRQAITDANAAPGFDTITFALSGTITLALPLPPVTDPAGVLIDGTGRTVTLDGGHRTWMLPVASGAVATVQGLSFVRSNNSAIFNRGTVAIWNSSFRNNSAGLGGALVNDCGAVAEIRNSTMQDNVADNSGGAVYNEGLLSVVASTLASNSAGLGGAIFNQRTVSSACTGQVAITNSTLTGNAAIRGGGVANYTGHVLLTNATLYLNTASVTAGGLYSMNFGDVDMRNSILLQNAAPTAPNCSGPVITASYPNLSNNLAGCSINGNPPIFSGEALDDLADNGGPTKTHALRLGTAALSKGDLAVCAAAPVSGKDQRGKARPTGAGCELGAFEADVVGGRGLSVETGDGPFANLSWQGGNAQTGYTLLRYNVTSNTTETLPSQLAGSTSYSDTSVIDGQAYCYVVIPTDGALVLGTSDALCVLSGTRVGHPLLGWAGMLRISLNQSNTATLAYQGPGIIGATSFLLVIFPIDGSAPQVRTLPGLPGPLPVPATTTHETGGATFCYDMIANPGPNATNPDAICAIPGFSTLGASAKAGAAPSGRFKPGAAPPQKLTTDAVTKRMQERLAPLAGKVDGLRQRAEEAAAKALPATPGRGQRQ